MASAASRRTAGRRTTAPPTIDELDASASVAPTHDEDEEDAAASIAQRRALRAAQRRAAAEASDASFSSPPPVDQRARSATQVTPALSDSDGYERGPSASAPPPLTRYSTLESPKSDGAVVAVGHKLKRAESTGKLTEISGSGRASLVPSAKKKRSTATVECFVQRRKPEQVADLYERLFTLLYPDFQPTEVDEDTLHTSLYDLRDEWQKNVRERTVPLLVHEIAQTAAAGVQYVLDEAAEPHRPLVITNAQLQQMMRFSFERKGAAAAAASVDDDGDTESQNTDDTEDDVPADLRASSERMHFQRLLRPLSELFLNLHQATIAHTPMRETLREATTLMLTLSYGYEEQMLTSMLGSFKFIPTSGLPPGVLQRIATEVCDIAFELLEARGGDGSGGSGSGSGIMSSAADHVASDTKDAVLSVLLLLCRCHLSCLTPLHHLTFLELTMSLGRPDQVRELISKYLLPWMMKQIPAQFVTWCVCGRGGGTPTTEEGAPPPSSSAPASIDQSVRHLKSDSTSSVSSTNSTTTSSSAAPRSMVVVPPALCILCQDAEADELTDSTEEFARKTFQRMIDAVVQVRGQQVPSRLEHSAIVVCWLVHADCIVLP